MYCQPLFTFYFPFTVTFNTYHTTMVRAVELAIGSTLHLLIFIPNNKQVNFLIRIVYLFSYIHIVIVTRHNSFDWLITGKKNKCVKRFQVISHCFVECMGNLVHLEYS